MNTAATMALPALTDALVSHFRQVQHERMQGIPILNTALQVEAVGFEWAPGREDPLAEGVLITPWFMSLVRLAAAGDEVARVGGKRIHAFGRERFEFITAEGGPTGRFESCSLFSPMDEFDSQSMAREVALAVLAELRAPEELVVAPPAGLSSTDALPSRRAFMLGRRSV